MLSKEQKTEFVANLSEEQKEGYVAACNVVMDWLNENCYPDTTVIIDHSEARLVDGKLSNN